MPINQAKKKLLVHAATRVGGVAPLAEKLGITQPALRLYLGGEEPLPDALFLRLVDIISEDWPKPQDGQAGPRTRP
jgi:hypothetical protein